MKNKILVNNLVKAAMLTALSIILSRVLGIQLSPNIKISFGTLPLMLVGMLFGPLLGALAGLCSDMIGIMINLGGTFHPGFTLGAILTAMVPGFIFKYGKEKNINTRLLIVFVILFVYGINHGLLTPLWLTQLYGTPYKVLLAGRAIKVIPDAIINYILLLLIYERILPRIKH
ncbi:folate family ECF transporter S component [Anaerococcus tetradius]|uniref:folate family ECF transporter S component n=1 Tax=Anaerococcus tetradius TaxID=33036 RepID=UPI0023F2490F|nr:folate family ECF transporter S component [Anaerococcus tetradius]